MEAIASNPLSPVQQAQTLEIQQQIRSLARRDAEVRAHEQAHASVGGAYASAPSYEYQRGPNGVSYAVGGHVDIDVAPVPGDPAATLKKMQVVQRAALAVAEPSPADRAVAAKAAAQASEARAELAAEVQVEPTDAGKDQRNNPLSTLGASVDISV
ncbi:MAG: putative metalloprotease CJM1_0395 family protein [Pseudomonadales bacterium]